MVRNGSTSYSQDHKVDLGKHDLLDMVRELLLQSLAEQRKCHIKLHL
jgi:hypothetical protein